MFLEKLNIIQFKNIESATLNFSHKINCFVGDNGVGKTNILDSIHYLSMCKSAFVLSDKQSVMHGKDFFMLSGEYKTTLGSNENINCSFKSTSSKKIKRNDKEYQRLSEHIGLLPLVIIAPSDADIINDSGQQRRRYIDQLLSQTNRTYLNSLMKYNHVLAQRNTLLKNMKGNSQKDILEIIDLQLCQLGTQIYTLRREIIEQLIPVIKRYYKIISGDKEQLEIAYQSKLDGTDMMKLLQENFERDCINQFTSCGVHRDNIKMDIMGYPIRKYGSQGQQKSFILALKLAQFDLMAQHTQKIPILLLDDVFDKLDQKRVEGLINIVCGENFGQIFISDCNKLRLHSILNKITNKYSIFTVNDSDIILCNEKNQSL